MLFSIFRRRKVNLHDHPSQSSNIGDAHPFAEPPPQIRVFALIIGINKYKSSRISNLVGAVPDADAMRDYLQNHLGVPSSQIRNLRDSEATRAAIIDGIKAFSLNDEIKEGDPILIYYAGHGGSAKTPKGWEAGSTGKIELLIPYDHSSPLDDGNPKHGIPDRALGALLSHLANKKGDNITVILDCCHSGSGTRKLDPTCKARQTNHVGNVPSNLDQDIWSILGSERGTEAYSGFVRKGLRSHVLLAACRPQEFAYERMSRGVFTVALLKTLVDIGIDKLTYATLFDRMPSLPNRQNPQCEGDFLERSIFKGKASGKQTASVHYKICRKGDGYVMPDAGEAAGITVGAEFEVYQDQNSVHLLGTVVACELSAFSTTLYARGSGFALCRGGVALKSRAGTDEQLRVYVADESLKDLIKKIDPNQRIIQLVGRDHGAEFGMALEDGKVIFNIYDTDVTRYGLTRMAHTLDFTSETISTDIDRVLRAAAHFYWHRRRTLKTGRGLAGKVKIEVTELQLESVDYDDLKLYGPTASSCDRIGGKEFDLRTETAYGWKISNNCAISLYPALFYFDNSDWSVTPYYVPPIALGSVDPPLKGRGHLTVGYGDSGSVPHRIFLREGQNVNVGILKLFLSRKQVNSSHIAQSSPFAPIGGRSTAPSSSFVPIGSRSTTPSSPFVSSRGTFQSVMPEHFEPTSLPWDTVEIPVVQRRHQQNLFRLARMAPDMPDAIRVVWQHNDAPDATFRLVSYQDRPLVDSLVTKSMGGHHKSFDINL